MKNALLLILFGLFFLSSCIKDDFVNDTVDPEIRIISTIDTIELNTSFQFESQYLNNIGQSVDVDDEWSSSEPSVISIDSNGLAQAVGLGISIISVSYTQNNQTLTDEVSVAVGENTVETVNVLGGEIVTTSSYVLEGKFEIKQDNNNLVLEIDDTYRASTSLPGLYVYLSNNKNSISNALEVSKVDIFDGAHSYIVPNVGLNEYAYVIYFCKPFNVKVGEGEIL